MIRYALACDKGHEFESWFSSSDAYEEQRRRKLVSCPSCGSVRIDKMLMAPRLTRTERQRGKARGEARGEARESVPANLPAGAMPDASTPGWPVPGLPVPVAPAEPTPVAIMSDQEREFRAKLKALREHVTRSADYVGKDFSEEARRMHYGESEHRSIYGEASLDDAKALHEEGIEFLPLPVLPDERN